MMMSIELMYHGVSDIGIADVNPQRAGTSPKDDLRGGIRGFMMFDCLGIREGARFV